MATEMAAPATPLRVLLATDGSDRSVRALQEGLRVLADDREITVLSVAHQVVPLAPLGGLGVAGTPTAPMVTQALDAEEARASEAASTTVAELGVEARTAVVAGGVGEAICSYAASGDFDVVVVGAHSPGWLQRLLESSASDHVVHHAPCPVLVVSADE